MNTKLDYLYRDACNYKTFHEVIFKGDVEFSDIALFLKDKTFFIPSEVGLKDLQELPLSSDDHIWHEIESVSTTSEFPTIPINAHTLIGRFQCANENNWNEYDVFERLGIL